MCRILCTKILILKQKCFRSKQIYSHRVRNIHIYFSDTIFNLTALGREQKKILNVTKSIIDKVINTFVNILHYLLI